MLEGDSLEVVSLLMDQAGPNPWSVYGLFQDCYVLTNIFITLKCVHVKKCANSVADRLAKGDGVSTPCWDWVLTPPPWLESYLLCDVAALGQHVGCL